MSHRDASVIILAALSALFDIAGTATVWKTFVDTAAFAERITSNLDNDAAREKPRGKLTYDDLDNVGETLADDRAKNRNRSRDQLQPFRISRITQFGLSCFVLGAVLGFLDVCIAI